MNNWQEHQRKAEDTFIRICQSQMKDVSDFIAAIFRVALGVAVVSHFYQQAISATGFDRTTNIVTGFGFLALTFLLTVRITIYAQNVWGIHLSRQLVRLLDEGAPGRKEMKPLGKLVFLIASVLVAGSAIVIFIFMLWSIFDLVGVMHSTLVVR